jgi:tRNA(Ile)-lysidine synthase
MSEITTKIDKTVKKFNMLQKGDKVVVGVSGGADSMLLLSYFIERQNELDLKLIVANVEHGIRGEESEADSAFVENFCKEKNIEFHCMRIDAPALAKEAGEGVEEYSRKRRYEFFECFNADKIATAHNLSDNVETVLFRLCRGTSLKGCRGIPPVREKIIRPLIELTSDEIRKECREQGIPFVVDSTNSDNDYSRNYIRNIIIPEFEKLNPSFEKAFERFIVSANEDYEFLNAQAKKTLESCREDSALDIEKLKSFDVSIIKRVLSLFAEEKGIILDELQLNGIFELLGKRGKFQIKNNLFAISDLKSLRIDEISFDDVCFSFEKQIISKEEFLINCELLRKEFDFYCDCDKISGDIIIRSRLEGDRITPEKRNCSKSLKKLFNELKIPQDKRTAIPVIADNAGIIGVSNLCTDERVRIDESTKTVLLLRITEDNF